MYLAARTWGIQPGEFWAMTLGEWMLEAEYHSGSDVPQTKTTPGVLSDAEVERLKRLIED